VFGPESPFWKSVYQHQTFIDHAFARGSSANNHLIGEMAGQFIASAAWPFFPNPQAWRDRATAILEDEIVKQTFRRASTENRRSDIICLFPSFF